MQVAKRARIIASVLLTGLCCASVMVGQEDERPPAHHRYKVIDMGTAGGPASFIPNPWSRVVNRRTTAIAEADTATVDPNAPHCLQPDCLINHAVKWEKGIQTDLGALPGANSSFPSWIDDRGWVSGFSENGLQDPLTGFPQVVGVLWKDGDIIELGSFGGSATYPNAINKQGQIVGGSLNTTLDPYSSGFFPGLAFFPVATQFRAFLWQNGVMHDLGTLGGPDSAALFVNDRGQVAGTSYTNFIPNATTGIPTQDPFLWIPRERHCEDTGCGDDSTSTTIESGTMLDLGTLGGTFGVPYWLNGHGEVVGFSALKGDTRTHPFLWNGESMLDLGTLGGDFGGAYSVNEAGEAVGFSTLSGNQATHAFLWRDGAMTDLGAPQGSQCSIALSINSRDQVVGESQFLCGPNNPGPGWLWEDGGPPVNLNLLLLPGSDFIAVEAVFINDRGEIAGNGVRPGAGPHAVLLIPCDRDHPDVEGCEYETFVPASIGESMPPAPRNGGIGRKVTRRR